MYYEPGLTNSASGLGWFRAGRNEFGFPTVETAAGCLF